MIYDVTGLLCIYCDHPRDRHWGHELYCTAKGKEFGMGPLYEPDITPVVCASKAEWDVAYESWKASGARGGRWGRPVLSPPDCTQCGKMRVEPELRPAFKPLDGFCTCSGEPST
jgi:hypothetical protein